ncbi:E3 ubiquitin-protein ligase RNF135 isoform X1 [Scleropages formosus]|uniref:E3 ubiquitin-protein ligase RNF135 isoform X1 n=1 Tax=Scleropages formosus TaxID=113540 RepID=UPI0010FAA209|nr:E3 ubiquitin-protein ligase RNF135 isoform X1 [Scleropages formosus]
MAALRRDAALEALAQHLKCSICYEIFLDPVTSSCGKHNYCKGCLSTFCEGNGSRRNCPQCMEGRRQDYTPQKNVTLCEIVEVLGRDTWEELLAQSEQNRDNHHVRLIRDSDGLDSQTRKFLTGQVTEDAGLYKEEANTSQCDTTALSAVRELSKVPNHTGVAASEPHEECGSSSENSELAFNGAQSVTEMLEAGAQQAESSDSQTETFARLNFSPELRHSSLAISQDGRRVEVQKPRGLSRSRQERFETSQVMADPEFACGAHYWDVDVTRADGWAIGVAYSSLGSGDLLGRTCTSWCLEWSNKRLCYWHDSERKLLGGDRPGKVRVVLDMSQGSLLFYSLREKKTLLHSALVNFTAPVRSAFWLYGLGNRNSLSFTGP